MLNIEQEKIFINHLISLGIQEILYVGLRIDDNNLGYLEDEMNLFMKALQYKKQIYDFAVILTYNELFGHFDGKIAYSLISTEGMNEFEKNRVEALIEFNF